MDLTREALTTQDVQKKKFSYIIQQGNSSTQVKLIWNIKLETDINFSMKGSLDLERITESRPTIQENFDFLISKVTTLEEENKELKRLNGLLNSQRNEAITQFDNLVIEKQCMENEMLGRFVDVLNEKKKKIRKLKENLKKQALKKQPSRAKLPEVDSDQEDIKKSSQVQTGDSLNIDNLTWDNTGPTPTCPLLEDEEPFEYLVQKRRNFDDSPPRQKNQLSLESDLIQLLWNSPPQCQLSSKITTQNQYKLHRSDRYQMDRD